MSTFSDAVPSGTSTNTFDTWLRPTVPDASAVKPSRSANSSGANTTFMVWTS